MVQLADETVVASNLRAIDILGEVEIDNRRARIRWSIQHAAVTVSSLDGRSVEDEQNQQQANRA
jgi:hypothetical protein